jgi:hypothetical protein
MSKWGAIGGAMQGAQQSLNIWLSSEMEKQKEARLQSYADGRYQQQRADQLADKEGDREYAKGLLGGERKYQEGRDKAKHKNALDLVDRRTKAAATKKNELDARLKYKLDDLATQREQLMKRLDNEMLSEDERKTIRGQVSGINGDIQGLLYKNSDSGQIALDPSKIDGIVNKLGQGNDEQRKAGLDQLRSKYGDDAIKQIESRMGSPAAGETNSNVTPEVKPKRGAGVLSQKAPEPLKPHQQVIAKESNGKRGVLADIFSPDPNDPRLDKDKSSKKKFESNVAVGRFMTKYGDGKRTPSYTEVAQVLPHVKDMSPEEQAFIQGLAKQYGLK